MPRVAAKVRECPLCTSRLVMRKYKGIQLTKLVLVPTCSKCGEQFLSRGEAARIDAACFRSKCRLCGVELIGVTNVKLEVALDGLCRDRRGRESSCFGLFCEWQLDNDVPDDIAYTTGTGFAKVAGFNVMLSPVAMDMFLESLPTPKS